MFFSVVLLGSTLIPLHSIAVPSRQLSIGRLQRDKKDSEKARDNGHTDRDRGEGWSQLERQHKAQASSIL
jgi:hypothetical protein